MTAEHPERDTDLRARKRVAAMRHIQRVALDLFDAHGYDAVSVAQVAEAADVGERSVYRYFGSKQMLLFHDEADVASLEMLAERVGDQSLLDAVRTMLADLRPMLTPEALHDAHRKLSHIERNPGLHAAFASYMLGLGVALGEMIAAARGEPPDDLAAQIQGRCLITALTVALERWHRKGTPLDDELGHALEILDTGFGWIA